MVLAMLLACTNVADADAYNRVKESRDDTGSPDDTSAGDAGPCPAGMALAAGICIDRWEAVIEGALGDPNQGFDWPDGSTTGIATSVPDSLPTVNVSWYQAWAACANAGKHLCTVTEWQGACSPDGRTYPWGEDGRPEDRCGLVEPDNETPATEGLTPGGNHPDCASPEGVHDLIGNAWEWVDPGVESDGRPLTAKLGGAYYSGYGHSRCATEPFEGHPPDFDGTIAARCCLSP